MKANKQQKDYLKSKIRNATGEAKKKFAEGKVVTYTRQTKAALLKKAGFTVDDDDRYYLDYLVLAPTAEMKKNKAAVEAYNDKLDTMLSEAYDNIELGDDADALEFLKNFVADLKKVK